MSVTYIIWRDAMRCDEMRCDAMRCDTIRYDTIRYDTIRYDTIRYDTIRYDTIRYDTIRYDTIRYDTIRYDTIRYDTRGPWLVIVDVRRNQRGSVTRPAQIYSYRKRNSNMSAARAKNADTPDAIRARNVHLCGLAGWINTSFHSKAI